MYNLARDANLDDLGNALAKLLITTPHGVREHEGVCTGGMCPNTWYSFGFGSPWIWIPSYIFLGEIPFWVMWKHPP
jgi:hypothetical protein